MCLAACRLCEPYIDFALLEEMIGEQLAGEVVARYLEADPGHRRLRFKPQHIRYGPPK
jgi:hypothetical protein